ncbi:MAG: hypothetical protein Q6358_12625 [Candidatus Brocadiales bacterium]|nr:hypothetical protein [Candidatus Brocadiales bacterium]
MSINSISGGMPRVSSGASSKMKEAMSNIRQQRPQEGVSQGVTPVQTLQNSHNLLDLLGKTDKKSKSQGEDGIFFDTYA